MTSQAKTFDQVIAYSRGSGAMRVNGAGLLVGIDFSISSVVFGTGSKTFTLVGNANVNRDWAVGSSVRVLSQAAPLGEMIGTVTSYDPVTQSLVINVTTNTGSGTGTNWRIGSLENRRDSTGNLVEPAATNLRTSWADMSQHGPSNVVLTPNFGLSPQGFTETTLVTEAVGTFGAGFDFTTTVVANQPIVESIFAKEVVGSPKRYLQMYFDTNVGGIRQGVNIDIATGLTVYSEGGNFIFYADTVVYANGLKRFGLMNLTTGTTVACRIRMVSSPTAAMASTYTADGTGKIEVFGLDVTQAPFLTSPIPTTTAQATRNADLVNLTAGALAALKQGQGVVVVECDTRDVGFGQKRAIRMSGPTGDIRLAKRGVGTLGSIVRLFEADNKLIMPVNSSGITVSNNGLESLPIMATVNDRTGLPATVDLTSSWAFNGSNQFGYIGAGVEERFLSSDFSLWSGKGLGTTIMNALKWIGSRFLIPTSTQGLLALSDGAAYRRVNTPVITGQTNNSAVGTISGGITRIVLVGTAGQIYTSDDQGENWVARTSGVTGNFQGAAWAPVGGANGTFVAISSNSNASRYSTDGGVTWLAITGVGTVGFNDIKFANGLFVAVGLTGAVYTSALGIAYTVAANTNTTSNLNGVEFDTASSVWAACGSNSTIIVASDPTGTWTRYDAASTPSVGVTATLNEIRSFLGKFYVVGTGGTIIEFPPTVTAFTLRTSGTNQTLNGLDVNGTGTTLLICGSLGPLLSTTDGTTYTPRSAFGQTITGIAQGNGMYMTCGSAVGGSGYLATIAADGTVTRRASGTVNPFSNIRFINGFFYALESVNAVTRTADGVTITRPTWTGTSRGTNDLVSNGTIIVAFQSNSSYAISTDNGVTFGAQVVPSGGLGGNVIGGHFANGVWVIASQNGTNLGYIYTSTDPTNPNGWTQRYTGSSPMRSVIFSQRDQLWYASGDNGTLLYATDPTGTWLPVPGTALGAIQNTTLQASLFRGQFALGINKIGISYQQDQVHLSLNGSGITDNVASIPNITAVALGEGLNGRIRKVKVRPRSLTLAALNAETVL